MTPFLPLKDVTALHGAEINENVSRVINGGWYLQGKENEYFEENYSKFIKSQYTVGCANGLNELILNMLEIDDGKIDEVITFRTFQKETNRLFYCEF